MWAARGRWSGLSLLLLVALMVWPCHAARLSLAEETQEVTYETLGDIYLEVPSKSRDERTSSTDEGTTSTNEGTTSIDAGTTSTYAGTTSTDAGTNSTDAGTTSTDAGTTSTDAGTTSTDAGTNSTDAGTTSTDTGDRPSTTNKPDTEPTSDGSTPTGNTKPPTDTPDTSTPTPPIDELTLYEFTKEELNVTAVTLALCSTLVSRQRSSTGGVLDPPAGWWKLKKEQTQELKSLIIEDFCTKETSPRQCDELRTSLSDIMELLERLTLNVDDWTARDLDDLTVKNEELEDAYQAAQAISNFEDHIDRETFQRVINGMQVEVKRSQDKVNTKIENIKKDRTGSVVLVAVIGTLGGIMMVSVVGVMVYGAAKKKMKKESSTTPYNKLQGENIPIDAFLSDGPRADPYTSQSPPPRSGDPYPSSHNGRSEPMPRVTRIGKALPRTHF